LTFNSERNGKLGYIPALDGLRALAIIAVMLFHLKTKAIFPGGGIGVDVFFVLSGFLITTLLLQEWVMVGTISLRAFYERRVLRLLPAVIVFVVSYIAINLAFDSHEFTGRQSNDLLVRNVFLIAAYGFNWLIALGGIPGSGLSHLWSLSVEEQFYLAWPAVLLLTLRARVPAVLIMMGSALVVVVSAALPLILDGDWARFYYGTDFRLQGLMLGSLLAQLYVAGVVNVNVTGSLLFRVALVQAVLFLTLVILLGRNEAAVLFYGGHTLVAICSAILITGALFVEKNVLATTLSNSVLVYIGKRSYALYLWHAAINVWLQSIDAVPHFLLTVALSFLAAELSFRLVESPALRLKSRLRARPPRASEGESATTMGIEPNAA
jgi:peptidoglycan/LPS O-acetylase OafA/YrhL